MAVYTPVKKIIPCEQVVLLNSLNTVLSSVIPELLSAMQEDSNGDSENLSIAFTLIPHNSANFPHVTAI